MRTLTPTNPLGTWAVRPRYSPAQPSPSLYIYISILKYSYIYIKQIELIFLCETEETGGPRGLLLR